MARTRGVGAAFSARWSPVVAALWLAASSACADQWLDAPPGAQPPAPCAPGSVLDVREGRCVPASCASDHDCAEGSRCDLVSGVCAAESIHKWPPGGDLDPPCNLGASRCGPDGGTVQACIEGKWVSRGCPEGTSCNDGRCQTCTPLARRCAADGAAYEICRADASGWQRVTCTVPGSSCADGACKTCEPGASRCTASGRETCEPGGNAWVAAPCGDDGTCVDGSCVPRSCVPGHMVCDAADPHRILVCQQDGSAYVAQPCGGGTSCHATPTRAQCLDACSLAAAVQSGVGCEYWFTHLPNGSRLEEAERHLTLAVSNAGFESAWVRVSGPPSEGPLAIETFVPPESVARLELPWRESTGSGIVPAALRLEASRPVAAQLLSTARGKAPIGCEADECADQACALAEPCKESRASADGTQLIPGHLLRNQRGESEYVAFSPRHQTEGKESPGYVAVVATENNSAVTVIFTAWTQVAHDESLAAYGPGERQVFVLQAGEVLQLATAPMGEKRGHVAGGVERYEYGNDFAGTRILSSSPIAVFVGSDASRVPLGAPVFDHLLAQVPPHALWGKRYVGMPRTSLDHFTVQAGDLPTQVSFVPPVTVGHGAPLEQVTVAPGTSLRFHASTAFEMRSSHPVQVLQTVGTGQQVAPALLSLVPAERYAPEQLIQIPSAGAVQLFAPRGRTNAGPPQVTIADVLIDDWKYIDGTDVQVATVGICSAGGGLRCAPHGVYPLRASQPVGVVIFADEDGASAGWTGRLGNPPDVYRPTPF